LASGSPSDRLERSMVDGYRRLSTAVRGQVTSLAKSTDLSHPMMIDRADPPRLTV
jgi:hypothetical protein